MDLFIGIINQRHNMDFLKWAKNRKLPKALQSRRGWTQLFEHYRTEEPHIHQIEPTNQCPYTCIMCPRHEQMTRTKGYMDMSLFKKIIDEVSTYSAKIRDKEIELFHFGESLCHSKFAEMVQYTSSTHLKATLSLNPVDLNADIIERLLQHAPYKIIVSLDSMDGLKYTMIRGRHAKIDKAIHNTERLLQRHQQLGNQSIIIIRMIVMHVNRNEIDHFRRFWEEKGGIVEFRDFFPWSNPELKDLGTVEKYPNYMPCPFPWQYLVIQWNGDVVACCRDYNGTLKMGNVMDDTLKDIWNGEAYTIFREKMASGEGLSHFCKECLSIYSQ